MWAHRSAISSPRGSRSETAPVMGAREAAAVGATLLAAGATGAEGAGAEGAGAGTAGAGAAGAETAGEEAADTEGAGAGGVGEEAAGEEAAGEEAAGAGRVGASAVAAEAVDIVSDPGASGVNWLVAYLPVPRYSGFVRYPRRFVLEYRTVRSRPCSPDPERKAA